MSSTSEMYIHYPLPRVGGAPCSVWLSCRARLGSGDVDVGCWLPSTGPSTWRSLPLNGLQTIPMTVNHGRRGNSVGERGPDRRKYPWGKGDGTDRIIRTGESGSASLYAVSCCNSGYAGIPPCDLESVESRGESAVRQQRSLQARRQTSTLDSSGWNFRSGGGKA